MGEIMDIVERITQAIEPSLAAMGYAVVQVKLGDSGKRKTLTVMAERRDGQAMGVEDCTHISRRVSALLDVEDPIPGAYDLEVCSPGLDRPLTRPEDFARFAGAEARIETLLPIEGQRKFRGMIEAMKDGVVTLATAEGKKEIRCDNIRHAKLMLSEALAKAALKKKF